MVKRKKPSTQRFRLEFGFKVAGECLGFHSDGGGEVCRFRRVEAENIILVWKATEFASEPPERHRLRTDQRRADPLDAGAMRLDRLDDDWLVSSLTYP